MGNHIIRRLTDRWWVQMPIWVRRISPFLAAAWADGLYLTARPMVGVLLPVLVFLIGLGEGATHWSCGFTIWDRTIVSVRAVAFVQMLPLLYVATAAGALSAQLGLLLVIGFALGDWFLAGPAFPYEPLTFFWHFLQIGVPRLISYLLFFMLAVQPALAARGLANSIWWPKRFAGAVKFWFMAVVGAAIQGFIVFAWVNAAPMAVRPFWMWAWHGQFPPLMVPYFKSVLDPWIPAVAVVAALVRAIITWWVGKNASLREKASKLAAAFAEPNQQPALTQRVPSWLTALLFALIVTLLAAGFIATLKLGYEIFAIFAVIFLARAVVLPLVPGWPIWVAITRAVPMLFRWLGVFWATYAIAQLIYLPTSSATWANTGAGMFAPELTGIVLGIAVTAILMPRGTNSSGSPIKLTRFKLNPWAKGATAAILLIVSLAHASPALAYCADSWCCFIHNQTAILTVAALVLVIAGLLIFGGVALTLAAAGETAELAVGVGEGGEALETAQIIDRSALFLRNSLPVGTLEPGAQQGILPVISNDLPEILEGFPEFPEGEVNNFLNTPTPEVLPPGTTIYRIVGNGSPEAGSWWTDTLPSSESEWRSQYAVPGRWNGDGGYVEYTIPEEGLPVWTGQAAPQQAGLPDYILSGGGRQIWMPPDTVTPSFPRPTPWNLN